MYATLAYLPPARLNRDAFLRNITHFKTEYPLILYSDQADYDKESDTYSVDVLIPDPTSIKMSRNRVAIHNRIFLHALEIAQQRGLKRFIYLESDCRVGHDGWDKRVFDEAEQYKDMFCAGTPAIYNKKAMHGSQLNWVGSECVKYGLHTNFRVPEFNANKARPLGAWFIMGAGAVYPVAITADLMMGFERDAHQKAIKTPAFDLFIGLRCFQLFGAKAVQKLPFLSSVFSTFGNKVNSERDRIAMVKSGKYAICHQIKSDTDCLT